MQLEAKKGLLTQGEMSMTRLPSKTREFSERQKCTGKMKIGPLSSARMTPAAFVAVTRAATFLTMNQNKTKIVLASTATALSPLPPVRKNEVDL